MAVVGTGEQQCVDRDDGTDCCADADTLVLHSHTAAVTTLRVDNS